MLAAEEWADQVVLFGHQCPAAVRRSRRVDTCRRFTDEAVFGKVYDRKVVSRMARYLKNYKAGVTVAFVPW